MAGSFNRITIVGYLGRDPEMRYLPSGDPVASFSVATTEPGRTQDGQQQPDRTTWFRVSAAAPGAKSLADGLKTGADGLDRLRQPAQVAQDELGRAFRKPALRRAPTAELVRHLADANAWWRLTAQRLLVERQDSKAVAPLEELARGSKSPVGRALLGKAEGDEVDVEAPRGAWRARILSIRR